MESKNNGSGEPRGRTGIKTQTYRLEDTGRGKGKLGSKRVALTYIHYQM